MAHKRRKMGGVILLAAFMVFRVRANICRRSKSLQRLEAEKRQCFVFVGYKHISRVLVIIEDDRKI